MQSSSPLPFRAHRLYQTGIDGSLWTEQLTSKEGTGERLTAEKTREHGTLLGPASLLLPSGYMQENFVSASVALRRASARQVRGRLRKPNSRVRETSVAWFRPRVVLKQGIFPRRLEMTSLACVGSSKRHGCASGQVKLST